MIRAGLRGRLRVGLPMIQTLCSSRKRPRHPDCITMTKSEVLYRITNSLSLNSRTTPSKNNSTALSSFRMAKGLPMSRPNPTTSQSWHTRLLLAASSCLPPWPSERNRLVEAKISITRTQDPSTPTTHHTCKTKG